MWPKAQPLDITLKICTGITRSDSRSDTARLIISWREKLSGLYFLMIATITAMFPGMPTRQQVPMMTLGTTQIIFHDMGGSDIWLPLRSLDPTLMGIKRHTVPIPLLSMRKSSLLETTEPTLNLWHFLNYVFRCHKRKCVSQPERYWYPRKQRHPGLKLAQKYKLAWVRYSMQSSVQINIGPEVGRIIKTDLWHIRASASPAPLKRHFRPLIHFPYFCQF